MKPFKYNPQNNSGSYRHRITIETISETENDMGDVLINWITFKTAWSMIKTVRGNEFVEAASTQGERIVRFIIRYTAGITNDMRIIYDGRIFEIISPPINDDELNDTLTIMAREVV